MFPILLLVEFSRFTTRNPDRVLQLRRHAQPSCRPTRVKLPATSSTAKGTPSGCAMGNLNRLRATVAVLATMGTMVPMVAMAADADPLQDFCVADMSTGLTINGFPCKPAAKVSVHDFTYPGLNKAGNTTNRDMVAVTPASVVQFPGLNTLGISAARVDFAKVGIDPPHTHPRATEILLLAQGELYVGFVSTNNTLFATVLKVGELLVFPRGLVHFQLNVGKGSALGFAAFSSRNPGTQQLAPALFTPDIKDEVLEKGFGIDGKTVDMIQANFRNV